jgi:hypothetical protein
MLDKVDVRFSPPSVRENAQRLGKKLHLLPEAGSLGSHYLPWALCTFLAAAVRVKDSSARAVGSRSAAAVVC